MSTPHPRPVTAHTHSLLVDGHGTPVRWAHWHEVAHLVASDAVAWSHGEPFAVARGGLRADETRSIMLLPPVLAHRGACRNDIVNRTPHLTNPLLFARDRHLCMYCGQPFAATHLSRDHVTPRCEGGADTWTNAVTACRRCNHRKGGRTPEASGMALLAVPYAPNHAETLILEGRRILADQMQFLIGHVPASRRARWAALPLAA